MGKTWIAVDLDGTLAHYEASMGSDIGRPIAAMMARVKGFVADGKDVRIFTARAGDPAEKRKVEAWLKDNGLAGLQVTNVKEYGMSELYDDRAIRVYHNDGNICYGCQHIAGNFTSIAGGFQPLT